MSKKTVAAGVVAGIALGVLATPAPDPKPVTHFKFIHGPTKYITKKVPEEIVTPPPVVMDWPESCSVVMADMNEGVKKANLIYNAADKYFKYIDHLQLRQYDDPNAAYKVDDWLAAHSDKVATDLQDMSEDASNLNASLAACKEAVTKAQQEAQNRVSGR